MFAKWLLSSLLGFSLALPAGGCQLMRDQQKQRTVFVRVATSQNLPTTVENPTGEQSDLSQPEYDGDTLIFIVTKHW